MIPAEADEAFVVDAAQNDERKGAWLEGKQILKVIYVKGKLLNIVAK